MIIIDRLSNIKRMGLVVYVTLCSWKVDQETCVGVCLGRLTTTHAAA